MIESSVMVDVLIREREAELRALALRRAAFHGDGIGPPPLASRAARLRPDPGRTGATPARAGLHPGPAPPGLREALMTVLTNVLSLIVACVVGVGPVALLAVLQNRRDRRAQALFHEVATQLPAEALRSDVALDVWCALLSRRATVRLDLGRARVLAGVGDDSPSPAGPAGVGAARGGRARGRPPGRSAPGPHHRREPARHAPSPPPDSRGVARACSVRPRTARATPRLTSRL